MTIMLQAGFLLVLVTAFYLLLNFYTKTQQVLTARNHAERVIQFVDDKIRHAGLGLWGCTSSRAIRSSMYPIEILSERKGKRELPSYSGTRGYKLPLSLSWLSDGLDFAPLVGEPTGGASSSVFDGNVLVLLYAEKEENEDFIMAYTKKTDFTLYGSGNLSGYAEMTFLHEDGYNSSTFTNDKKGINFFRVNGHKKKTNIYRWGVVESIGRPFFVDSIQTSTLVMKVWFYADSILGDKLPDKIAIPEPGEVMYLKCMQMYAQKDSAEGADSGSGGSAVSSYHFIFREPERAASKQENDGKTWGSGVIQEDGIIDLYMTLDRSTNIFTLYVLATGGTNDRSDTPRPDAWPKEAEPKGATDEEAREKWLESDKNYSGQIVYVARKSWKLNNVPDGFVWD